MRIELAQSRNYSASGDIVNEIIYFVYDKKSISERRFAMTPQEMEYMEIENYSRLQRIKKDNGSHDNPALDYEISVSTAKLSALGVNVENITMNK